MSDEDDKKTLIATVGMILWPIISIFLAVIDAPPSVCFTSIIFGWFIYPFMFLISYSVTDLSFLFLLKPKISKKGKELN